MLDMKDDLDQRFQKFLFANKCLLLEVLDYLHHYYVQILRQHLIRALCDCFRQTHYGCCRYLFI